MQLRFIICCKFELILRGVINSHLLKNRLTISLMHLKSQVPWIITEYKTSDGDELLILRVSEVLAIVEKK